MGTESGREDGEPAVRAEGLSRSFGDHLALSEIDFSLSRGQKLAVFGPNGSGKTTLLKLLAALLRPSSGSLDALGCKLPHDARSLRPKVGYLGHEPLLYKELTPLENLCFYGRVFGVADPASRARELLCKVGADDTSGEPVRTLSKGLQQRVAVCRALMHGPELLLLDEPYSHLDPAAASSVEPLIAAGGHITRLLVTHDVRSGIQEADRVLCLIEGRSALNENATCVDEAQIEELYRRPAR